MKQSSLKRPPMIGLAIASLSAVLLAACDSGPQSGVGEVTEAPASSPVASAEVPAAAPAAPATPAPATARCDTPNHLAEVTQQNGQGILRVLKKPNEIVVTNQPGGLATLSNPDGSTTYGVVSGSTFYVRVFSDGTCFIQVVDTNGVVTLEENGRSG